MPLPHCRLRADRHTQKAHDRIKMLILSNPESGQHESVRTGHPPACLEDQGDFGTGLVAELSAQPVHKSCCLRADIWVGDTGCFPCSGAAAGAADERPTDVWPQRNPLKHRVKGQSSEEMTFLPLFLVPAEPALTPTMLFGFTGSSQERK